jgi:hypothetical protein
VQSLHQFLTSSSTRCCAMRFCVLSFVTLQQGGRGGPEGPEPTRFGDWQMKGRVSHF